MHHEKCQEEFFFFFVFWNNRWGIIVFHVVSVFRTFLLCAEFPQRENCNQISSETILIWKSSHQRDVIDITRIVFEGIQFTRTPWPGKIALHPSRAMSKRGLFCFVKMKLSKVLFFFNFIIVNILHSQYFWVYYLTFVLSPLFNFIFILLHVQTYSHNVKLLDSRKLALFYGEVTPLSSWTPCAVKIYPLLVSCITNKVKILLNFFMSRHIPYLLHSKKMVTKIEDLFL